MFKDKKNLLTILFAVLTFATFVYVFAAGGSEFELSIMPVQCSDSIDNDGDQLVDFPADPGCSSVYDNDESNAQVQSTGIPVSIGNATINGSASITGFAAQGATVILKKNNVFYGITTADASGRFSFSFSNLETGANTFSLEYENADKQHSTVAVVPVNIGLTTELNLFLAPLIKINRPEFFQSEQIVISGVSIPNAGITLIVHSKEQVYHGVSDALGFYSFEIPALDLELGSHVAEVSATLNGQESYYSQIVAFAVKEKAVTPVLSEKEPEVVVQDIVPKKDTVAVEPAPAVDAELPEYVRIKELSNIDIPSGKVEFSIEAHDRISGLDRYEIKIDDGPVQSLPANDSLNYTTLPLNPGPHKITVKAIDRAGNFMEASEDFKIFGGLYSSKACAEKISVCQSLSQIIGMNCRRLLLIFLLLYLMTLVATAVYVRLR
jgi:hypothetical protein